MSEKVFSIESYSPLDLLGVGDKNLNTIKNLLPKLKIIARGEHIKVIGDTADVESFESLFNLMLIHYDHFGRITEDEIRQLAEPGAADITIKSSPDVLVHGRNGQVIKARTANQVKIVESIDKSDMVFAIGPAGTGKTYTAVALAVRALKNKEVKRI